MHGPRERYGVLSGELNRVFFCFVRQGREEGKKGNHSGFAMSWVDLTTVADLWRHGGNRFYCVLLRTKERGVREECAFLLLPSLVSLHVHLFFPVYSPYLDEVFRSSPSPLDGAWDSGDRMGMGKKRKRKGFEIDERALSHSLGFHYRKNETAWRKSSLLRVSAGL